VKTRIKTGLTLGAVLAIITLILAAASCRSGDNFMWDDWAGSAYLAEAGDITIDPDPLVVNTISHLTMTFDVTAYTDLVSKESYLDTDTKTLTVVVYARERDGQGGTWDGTLTVAVTFPDSGLWNVVIPQEGGREAGLILNVEPPEGAPVEDAWAGDAYYPDVGDVITDPDPLVANDFAHLTFNFNTTTYTELISQESSIDPDAMTLTVTIQARERDNQLGSWDGVVTVPVTFLESGVWRVIVPQEGTDAAIDLYVEPAPGTPTEESWVGDAYFPDAGDIITSPDPVTVNKLNHITVSFLTTAYTELISLESELDAIGRTLTITVYARERDNQTAVWDGKVDVPVTFLERGVWQIIIPQQGEREMTLDVYVYPQEDIWAGDAYLPDAGDIVTDPDPIYLNDLVHITVNFNTTEYTELISQEWLMDPGTNTLTITVYARERADRESEWDGTVTVPATFLAAGVWHIVIEQEGGATAGTDVYVSPLAP